jgi:ribonuclease E
LIVIDFIDMRDRKNNLKVEKEIKAELKKDKARTKIGRISAFGLLEMSRQRIRPSIQSINSAPCRYCRGKGVIPSVESLGLNFLRRLRLETLKEGDTAIRGRVPTEVANYLLNRKKKELLEMEIRREVSITIEADSAMIPGESEIIRTRQPGQICPSADTSEGNGN